MAEVSRLKVVPKYNQQAVDHLETLLAQAKAGEVLELVCVAKLSDGHYENSWTGCEDLVALVGQLERMKQLTLRRMDG